MKPSSDKVRLVVTAAYRNGVPLLDGVVFVADSHVAAALPETPNSRVITLRFAGSPNNVMALHRAFLTGETEINIEGVKPLDI